MFDTHSHLNFKAFKKDLANVIERARQAGVQQIVVPGTDVLTSVRAVEIAEEYDHIFAAVGIHPHHVFQYLTIEQNSNSTRQELIEADLKQLDMLLQKSQVVAVGEVGMDMHVYENTKYEKYVVDTQFLELQKELFAAQIKLAIHHKKSLILHNREAKSHLIPILQAHWDTSLKHRAVFHCCEPDTDILKFAQNHHMYIGIDGDITYSFEKQQFIQHVPLEMLVLETDAPFLLPEPLKSAKKYPNESANIPVFIPLIAKLKHVSPQQIIEQTTENAKKLFQTLPKQ